MDFNQNNFLFFIGLNLWLPFLEKINSIGDKKNIMLMDNSRVHTAFNKRTEKGFPTVEEQMIRKNIEVRFINTYALW
ncbi:MAG: hypothetical protein I3270_01600 [Candidatus Moeniiplasma glomeromycotorum]|nr:hypothetical protein [Candidatus Moeniiplasma glomeromycotorum]MCE8166327.1 hypothetical protein [Candidatus Moeniiplasma glomeromycotorum]MCE8166809.1 hypothetical protein [Candidatus Moeniiplasma glomeromycotorum]